MSTNQLVLHQHPFAAFCWKPLIALHELELPFRPHLVDGEDGRRDLARVWPLASIPVLRDETADLTLPQSSTIVEYLDRLASPTGRLIPQDHDRALQARLWDRIVDDYIARPMQTIVGDSLRSEEDRDATGVAQARGTLDQAFALLEARLRDQEWAAGDAFTIADCAAAPALFYARVVHPWDEAQRQDLTRYYRALTHRPSIRRVIDDARPYRHLFPLPWPEDVDAHQHAQ
ncbi:MAG: glutathione S-transferase [Solirubrobacterales bacterium]|nr:glutathione S-transferase [Solirubrobacterales bacterium]